MSATKVRFFTSAALRSSEEVDGEITPWLPRWIGVEFDSELPVTGVWRSARGERQVCWYGAEVTAEIVAAHAERFEDEPFWLIDRRRADAGELTAIECSADGQELVRRTWTFDVAGMPKREEVRSADGEGLIRTYRCNDDGAVYGVREERAGQTTSLPRPHRFPIPELGGEPFPCGRWLRPSPDHAGARLVEPLGGNAHQARAVAVYRSGAVWARGIATMTTSKHGWSEQTHHRNALEGPGLAPLVLAARLEAPQHRTFPFRAVVEARPPGQTIEEIVRGGVVTLAAAVDLAQQVGDVATRMHSGGGELGAIRPELIYGSPRDGHLVLEGILHRGPGIIDETYSGEAMRWPPVFAEDWSSPDDVRGLAQLVWFMTTNTHPFHAPADRRWDPSWNEFRHDRRRPQPWTGPASVERLLTSTLFGAAASATLEEFLAELDRCAGRPAHA